MNGIVQTWRQQQSLDRAQSHGQGSSLAPSIQICPAALPMSHFHSVDLFVSVLSFLPSLFFKFCFFPSAYSICHIEMCPDSLIQCQIHLVIKGKTFPIPILFFPTSTIATASKVVQANLGRSQVHTHSQFSP